MPNFLCPLSDANFISSRYQNLISNDEMRCFNVDTDTDLGYLWRGSVEASVLL